MIRFFREFRKKMSDDGKPLKYLKYAIGEVVLVVIGILIALQVNISMQKNTERRNEKIQLQNILADLKKEIVHLDSVRKEKAKKVAAAKNMITCIDGGDIVDLKKFNRDQARVFWMNSFSPNNQSFIELMNSGNLHKISNNEIRQTLLVLNKKYEGLEFTYEHIKFEVHEFLYKKMIDYVDYDLMWSATKIDELTPKDSISLHNNLLAIRGNLPAKNTYTLMLYNHKFASRQLEDLLLTINGLIELIEIDLEH